MSIARVPAVAIVAVAAWVLIISEAFSGGGAFAGRDHLCGVNPGSLAEFGEFLLSWSVMVAAMMLPDLAIDMRERLSTPRPVALMLFLVGFFVVWETFGCVVLAAGGIPQGALGAPARRALEGGTGGVALLGLVAVGQFTSARFMSRQRFESPPRRPPLDGIGIRAGLAAGAESLSCCWGIMTLMLAAKLHDPLSVAAFTFLVTYVRRGRFGISAARLVGVAALADALVALTLRTSPL